MPRITVVNDDTTFLEMMAAVLAEGGWDTTCIRESHGAFARLRQDPPDLIILDIRMESPESGWNLLEVITLDRSLRHVPVIVCSAALFDLRAHEDWLHQNGIAVLPKPFNIDQLFSQVEQTLQEHRHD